MAADRERVRASDAEREAVVGELRAHAAAGRLTVEELGERVAAALTAQTRGDLSRLTADLPSGTPARRRRRTRALGEGVQAYLAVMALLVAIWALTGAGYFWPVWPMLGWGVALALPGGCAARSRTQHAGRVPGGASR